MPRRTGTADAERLRGQRFAPSLRRPFECAQAALIRIPVAVVTTIICRASARLVFGLTAGPVHAVSQVASSAPTTATGGGAATLHGLLGASRVFRMIVGDCLGSRIAHELDALDRQVELGQALAAILAQQHENQVEQVL